jgi:tetraacyldisaccharide 4'-kinase
VSRWLEHQWERLTPVSLTLYPVSLIFRSIVAARRAAYSARIFESIALPVPVIVVGNITVGGTGKTPLVLWLSGFLAAHGLSPGIVSRGYGAATRQPRRVAPEASALTFGDEPVLLAQRSGTPVWTGADRVAAARALLETHPACNVIVSDDGLQHYRLARTLEIAVIDGTRGFGNGLTLPAGPLREPRSRLRTVDAIVVNVDAARAPPIGDAYSMRIEGRQFRNLLNPRHCVEPEHFTGKRVLAIAGTGNPARFFSHLDALGMRFVARALPDHHVYDGKELAGDEVDAIVMTEKDAVKCARFASEKHWVLPVEAVPDPRLGELILRKLNR